MSVDKPNKLIQIKDTEFSLFENSNNNMVNIHPFTFNCDNIILLCEFILSQVILQIKTLYYVGF